MMMQIIAIDLDGRYLISLKGGWEEIEEDSRARGCVYDPARHQIYPSSNIHTLFSQVEWTPVVLSIEKQIALLEGAKDTKSPTGLFDISALKVLRSRSPVAA
jgi:hypothetical protein